MPGKGKLKKVQPLDTTTPNGAGQIPQPNPGEFPPEGSEIGLRRNTLGEFPARGHRAGGGTTIGAAERVAITRNLEFSAGGRSQLVATGPLSPAAANISARTGQVQISGTEDTSQSAGHVDRAQPAQPAPHADVGVSTTDGRTAEERGNPTPAQRRDTDGL